MSISADKLARGVFLACTTISAATTLLVLLFMITLALPVFQKGDFLSIWTGSWAPRHGQFGIFPMIAGTLWIAGLATLISLPLSLGTAFVITSLAPPRWRRLLGAPVRFMTGMPTVIYGFVGIFLMVPLMRTYLGGAGFCVLTAAVMLAVLISPTLILFLADSLEAVNPDYVRAARALGAGRVQQLLYIRLPQAASGMAAGLILALGRALGDTLIALMLAGNAIGLPHNLLDPARTLTAHIALVKAADYDSPAFRSIFTSGIALYLFTTLAVVSVRWIDRSKDRQS